MHRKWHLHKEEEMHSTFIPFNPLAERHAQGHESHSQATEKRSVYVKRPSTSPLNINKAAARRVSFHNVVRNFVSTQPARLLPGRCYETMKAIEREMLGKHSLLCNTAFEWGESIKDPGQVQREQQNWKLEN